MKVLLIEDTVLFADAFTSKLNNKNERVTITTASNKKDAESTILNEFFDLIIIDLTIPSDDKSFDEVPEHGQAVYYFASINSSGTPIRFLTASTTSDFLHELVSQGVKAAPWGGTQIPMLSYKLKTKVESLIDEICEFEPLVSDVNKININTRGKRFDLLPEEERALKIFTKENRGVSCHLQKFGGLSGNWVIGVSVLNNSGQQVARCVAKIGKKKLNTEYEAFEQHVLKLEVGAFAHVTKKIDSGLKNSTAIFYQLAENSIPLFEYLTSKPNKAEAVVAALRQGLKNWSTAENHQSVKISQIRRTMLDDVRFKKLVEKFKLTTLLAVEGCEVSLNESCIHGDLHCGNILIDPSGKPVIIDFGDVGEGFTCLDPVTIELSCIFHPDSKLRGDLLKKIMDWPNRDAYVLGNPYATFIEACREWAYDTVGSENGFLACAYSYAVRQLKYDTVDSSQTILLLNALAQQILKNKSLESK